MRRAPLPAILFTIASFLLSCEQPVVQEIVYTAPPNLAPTIDVSDTWTYVGQPVTMTATIYDPDGDELTVTWSGAFDGEGESVEWTPSEEGEYRVTVVASDGSLTASDEAAIMVEPEPWSPEPLHIYVFDYQDELYMTEECTEETYADRLQAYRLGIEIWNMNDDPGSPFTVVGGGLP